MPDTTCPVHYSIIIAIHQAVNSLNIDHTIHRPDTVWSLWLVLIVRPDEQCSMPVLG